MTVPNSEDKSPIDELSKSLYSRTAPPIRTKRKLHFDPVSSDMPKDWEHPPEEPPPASLNTKYEGHSMSFFTKLFIGSALFCILAVGVGAYLFFNGANLISADNIEIAIRGPVSAPGGEPVSFEISAINKNNVELQLVDMTVDFPPGSADASDPSKQITNHRKLLGNIPAGGEARDNVSVILYGEENASRQINVSLTYGVKGSSSSFTKTRSYDVILGSSPVNISVSGFKEVTSGQEFEMKVDIKSNSKEIQKAMVLKAQYPFGFTLTGSSLPASPDNATWRIGDLPPGGSRTITLRGKLAGEDGDVRAFRFSAGIENPRDPNAMGTQYAVYMHEVAIEKPFISLDIGIDGDRGSGDHVGRFGQSERVEVNWFNNLPVAVSNMVITARLSGSAYDKSLVRSETGLFDSAANTITWSGRTNPELVSVAAGDSGKVSFSMVPRDTGTGQSPVVNPKITYEVEVSADRPQEDNAQARISGAVSRTTKVSSNVSLTGRVVRSLGPFQNSGPVPPKAEETTTYTVIWSVDNTSSSVGNTQVTAALPAQVSWTGAVSPSTEDVVYNPNNGQVTWNIGSIGTYTSGSSRRREVAFQIALKPNVVEAGQYMTLVERATLRATDTWTGSTITSIQEYLTTRFSTDPAYREGDEIIRN